LLACASAPRPAAYAGSLDSRQKPLIFPTLLLKRLKPRRPSPPGSSTRSVDLTARVTAVASLLIAGFSAFVAWQNYGLAARASDLQDSDHLLAHCVPEFTGHIGINWPPGYSVPESIRRSFVPLLLVTCDLTNSGRRPLSVTAFSIAGRPPGTAILGWPFPVARPDSSILGLPTALEPGRTHRLSFLLGLRNPGGDAIWLLPPSGQSVPIAIDIRHFTDTLPSSLNPTGSAFPERWDFDLAFQTGLGATVHQTFGLHTDAVR